MDEGRSQAVPAGLSVFVGMGYGSDDAFVVKLRPGSTGYVCAGYIGGPAAIWMD